MTTRYFGDWIGRVFAYLRAGNLRSRRPTIDRGRGNGYKGVRRCLREIPLMKSTFLIGWYSQYDITS
jgi:hypothetical protein